MKIEPGFLPIILTVAAVVGTVAYSITHSTKDNFCTCQGMDKKVCPNTEKLKALYNAGHLTEYTDFAKLQGTPQWSLTEYTDFAKLQGTPQWSK